MSDFTVYETGGFQKDLEQDFGGRGEKIKRKLLSYVYPQLKINPYFGKNIKKLVNYEPETWRYRIGAYRFFYIIDGKKMAVIMLSADNRKEAY